MTTLSAHGPQAPNSSGSRPLTRRAAARVRATSRRVPTTRAAGTAAQSSRVSPVTVPTTITAAAGAAVSAVTYRQRWTLTEYAGVGPPVASSGSTTRADA